MTTERSASVEACIQRAVRERPERAADVLLAAFDLTGDWDICCRRDGSDVTTSEAPPLHAETCIIRRLWDLMACPDCRALLAKIVREEEPANA